MKPLVIAGSGLAGYNLAREFRKLDRERPLVVVTRDDGSFYSKPMLSNALASGKTAAQIPMASAAQMREQLAAEVLCHANLSAFDGEMVTIDGRELAYENLVLAVGAEQIRLQLSGDAAGEVLTVNDLADYAQFRRRLASSPRVAVIGAGLIGCEFANDLAATGSTVEVIDIAAWPLSRLLPEVCGVASRDAFAALGVRWHLQDSVSEVARGNAGLRLTLASGKTIEADLLLSAVGLRPRTRMAADAGAAVARGVVVDRWLKTSLPRVHALGDCAEVEGWVLPYVLPLTACARALAATLAGQPTAVSYPCLPVSVKTPALPTVVAPPPLGVETTWQVEQTADGWRALAVTGDGSPVGFALLGKLTAERAQLARRMPAWLPA